MGSKFQRFLFFCMTAFLFIGNVSGAEDMDLQMSNYKKLKDKLFKDYDKSIRPVIHHTNTTNVSISLVPFYIIDLDEQKSLLTMDAWLVLEWQDLRLSWNASNYDGLDHIQLADDFVWQPDITVYNSHSGTIDPKRNTHLIVYSSGLIVHVPPAVLTTFCPMVSEGSYPSDTIVCNIVFGSWSHDGWQIDLQTYSQEMYLEEFQNTNPRWDVQTELLSFVRDVKKYNCCEEPYVSVIAKFPLKRRPPAELKVVWAPSVLVMSLTLCMFWIPSGSGKKITLGSGLLFVLTLLIVYVAFVTHSPQASSTAVTYLESTMYAVASALLLEVLVINLGRLVGPHRPPPVLVGLLSGSLGKYLGICVSWRETIPGDRIQLKEDVEHVSNDPTANDEWLLIATAIDRILFVIYIVVLAAIHQI